MGKVPLTTTLEAALPQAPELLRHRALTPGGGRAFIDANNGRIRRPTVLLSHPPACP